MGEGRIIRFPNTRAARLEPIWPQTWEFTEVFDAGYFKRDVPFFECLSVFELKLLGHLSGWTHPEIDRYLDDDADDRGRRMALHVYGTILPIENVRWRKS